MTTERGREGHSEGHGAWAWLSAGLVPIAMAAAGCGTGGISGGADASAGDVEAPEGGDESTSISCGIMECLRPYLCVMGPCIGPQMKGCCPCLPPARDISECFADSGN